MTSPTSAVPTPDCDLCPRLVEFRHDNQAKYPDFFNAPVPSFGPLEAQVLVCGLAPGLKGANCTGRPFTGDYAGDLLYPTLKTFHFATGEYGARADDGFELVNCRITNAVRCVPPQNKTTGPEEKACRPFLIDEMKAMPNLKAILALGGVAHNAVIQTLGLKKSQWKFGHNARHELGDELPILFDSYHCSRYNTNTGRLTEEMFHDVFRSLCEEL
ncbi:uracil-DNA glycosylase [Terasakiella sp. SH-1]|uniref:uracil-DNA glycosylase n=1 Tax=Terasakiella sp. SH-1 TaxID=2560057 RepID=UPI0010738E4E|nr:uracil-DNA glycosylase [Terasakiella sp. SH-1]